VRRTRLRSAATTSGYEYVHVCVDDYSRLAYAEVLPDQKTTTAIGFLQRAVVFYRRRGIRVERLLTDNGSAYERSTHGTRKLGTERLLDFTIPLPSREEQEAVVELDRNLRQQSEEFARLTEETRAALAEVMPALLAQDAPVKSS
jgi:hypothetical protein